MKRFLFIALAACGTSGSPAPAAPVASSSSSSPSPPSAPQGSVTGNLASSVVLAKIREHKDELHACYHRGLEKNHALAGGVTVRFVIGEDGRVERAEAVPRETGPALDDAETLACIAGVFERSTFPAPAGGKVKVTYPIEFSNDAP